MIVVGMLIGAVPRAWPNRVAIIVGAILAVGLVWGLLVGGPGGTLLALVNLALGLGFTTWIRWTMDRAGDGPRSSRR